MLRDIITYGGQRLLTIYHENPELSIPNRYWKERKKVGRYWLEFEEQSVCASQGLSEEDETVEQELLTHTHPLCPCRDHEFCAIMLRRRSIEKPSRIFLPQGDGLRIEQDQWRDICEFVEKYTGIKLQKAPMACGDTFLFHYVQLRFRKTEKDTILVEATPGFNRINVFFKHNGAVCDCQTKRSPETDLTRTEFLSKTVWDAVDLYAYEDDKLWFYAQDYAPISYTEFIMHLVQSRPLNLPKIGYEANYSSQSAAETTRIGQEKTDLQSRQDRLEAKLLAAINPEQERSRLISRGGDQEVYRMIEKQLDHIWDEVWLLDPYLLDADNKAQLADWITMLCGSPANRVCGFYYYKEAPSSNMTLEQAQILLKGNFQLSELLRQKRRGLLLCGLNIYVHDRFLLCRAGERFEGLSIGTSLNSVNSNYFCIHTLSPRFAKECWDTFGELVREHTQESRVIEYE